MWSKAFWVGAIERVIRTAAQALLAMLAADKIEALGSVPWAAYLTVAAVAAATSLLMSLTVGAASVGPPGSASAVADRPRDYGLPTPPG